MVSLLVEQPGISARVALALLRFLSIRTGFFVLFLIVLSPRPHGIQNRFQAFAEFRQRILHPRRYFGVDLTVNKTAFLHSPELNGQDLLLPTDFFSSPKRFVPGSRSRRIRTFHLSPINARVVSTGQAGSTFFVFTSSIFAIPPNFLKNAYRLNTASHNILRKSDLLDR